MKRHLGIIMALAMAFTCLCGTTAFAAEAEPVSNVVAVEASDSGIVPYGSLSGYGQHWHISYTISATFCTNRLSCDINIIVPLYCFIRLSNASILGISK